ncbi:beta-1,3-glucanase family protein [Streptomyces sp. NPDC029006]|uniref:beta-1,3-glucanase family protein n=1 Tax=Streptomyces sp. NPDC029006 TaxID=3155467 RepID=UPI0033CFA7D0
MSGTGSGGNQSVSPLPTGALASGLRAQHASDKAPWDGLVVTDSSGGVLRVMAPAHSPVSSAPPTAACALNTSPLSRTAARCPRGRLCTSGLSPASRPRTSDRSRVAAARCPAPRRARPPGGPRPVSGAVPYVDPYIVRVQAPRGPPRPHPAHLVGERLERVLPDFSGAPPTTAVSRKSSGPSDRCRPCGTGSSRRSRPVSHTVGIPGRTNPSAAAAVRCAAVDRAFRNR